MKSESRQATINGESLMLTVYHQDVFSLPEGPVTLIWPAGLSKESNEDLSSWLDIIKRKIGRSAADKDKTA